MRTPLAYEVSSFRLCASLVLGAALFACSAASAPPAGDDQVDGASGSSDAAGSGGSSVGAGTGGTSSGAGTGGGDTAGTGGGGGTDPTGAGAGGGEPAGAGGTTGSGSGSGGAGAGGGSAGSADPGGSGGDSGSGGTGIDVPADPQVSLVYAHSPTTLYQMDPETKAVTKVGDFTCLFNSDMWDIAVDSTGAMVGTASDRMVSIDPLTAKCKTLANGSFPNSLTFIPKGTLDPNAEALVGFRGAEYVRIDPANGKISIIGNLNPNSTGQTWESSGDVVSIIGDKTYLTVHPETSSIWSGTDTIIEVDPVTGKATKVIGDVGFGKLWGLAYWDSIAYGFSDGGDLVQIDLGTGAGKSVPLPNTLADLSFYGAGVTTAARVAPPK